MGLGTAPAAVTVTNSGGADLVFPFSAVGLSGTDVTDYQITSDSCRNSTVAPGATCTVEVVFTPDAAGARSASVNFSSNAESSVDSVSLTGNGVLPELSALDSLAFPDSEIGASTSQTDLTVESSGGADLTFGPGAAAIAGPDSDDFAITADSCSGTTVAPGSTCQVSVTATPSVPGDRTASMTLTSNVAGQPHAVALSVTGVTVPGPPQIIAVVGGDTVASVVFNRPFDDGYSSITNYEYSLDAGSTWVIRDPAAADSPLLISGLTNRTTYTIALRAVNAVGPGPASATASGRPRPPGPGTVCEQLANNPQVVLSGGIVLNLGQIDLSSDCAATGATFSEGTLSGAGLAFNDLSGTVLETGVLITAGAIDTENAWPDAEMNGRRPNLNTVEQLDLSAPVDGSMIWGELAGQIRIGATLLTPLGNLPIIYDLPATFEVSLPSQDYTLTGGLSQDQVELMPGLELTDLRLELGAADLPNDVCTSAEEEESTALAKVANSTTSGADGSVSASSISGNLSGGEEIDYGITATASYLDKTMPIFGTLSGDGLCIASTGELPLVSDPEYFGDLALIFTTYDLQVSFDGHGIEVPANSISVGGLFYIPDAMRQRLGNKLGRTGAVMATISAGFKGIALEGQIDIDLAEDAIFSLGDNAAKIRVHKDLAPIRLKYVGASISLILGTSADFTLDLSSVPVDMGVFANLHEEMDFELGMSVEEGTVAISTSLSNRHEIKDALGIPGLTIHSLSGDVSLGATTKTYVTGSGGLIANVTMPADWVKFLGVAPETEIKLGIHAGLDESWCAVFELGEEDSTEPVLDLLNAGVVSANYAKILLAPIGCEIGGDIGEKLRGIGIAFNGSIAGQPIAVATPMIPAATGAGQGYTFSTGFHFKTFGLRGLATIENVKLNMVAGIGFTGPILHVDFKGRMDLMGSRSQVVGKFKQTGLSTKIVMLTRFRGMKLGGMQFSSVKARIKADLIYVAGGFFVTNAKANVNLDVPLFGKKGKVKRYQKRSPYACGVGSNRPCNVGEKPLKYRYQTVKIDKKNRMTGKASMTIQYGIITSSKGVLKLSKRIFSAKLKGKVRWDWNGLGKLNLSFSGKAKFKGSRVAVQGQVTQKGFLIWANLKSKKSIRARIGRFKLSGKLRYRLSVGLGYNRKGPFALAGGSGKVKVCAKAFGRKKCSKKSVRLDGNKLKFRVFGKTFKVKARQLQGFRVA